MFKTVLQTVLYSLQKFTTTRFPTVHIHLNSLVFTCTQCPLVF